MTDTPLIIPLSRMAHAQDLDLPAYQTAGAAGMDLCAAITSDIILA